MQDSLSKSKSPVNVSGNYSSMNIQENPIFSSSNSLERRSKSNLFENLLSKLFLYIGNNRNEYIIQKYKYNQKNLQAYLKKGKLSTPLLPSIESATKSKQGMILLYVTNFHVFRSITCKE